MALVSYITSIQHFNITIPDGNQSASVNLAVGTDETLCVPFYTYQLAYTGDFGSRLAIDVYFTAGSPPSITVKKYYPLSQGTVNVSIFVVEFDGTNVDVQQGTFSLGSTDLTDEVLIDSIDLTKTAAVHAYDYSTTSDDLEDRMVRCYFSDTTHIFFERDNASGAITGHWFLFEAQGTEFTVEYKPFSIAAGVASGNVVITSVAMGRTMIIGSFECNESSDDINQGSCRVWLYDSTHVYAERGTGGGAQEIDLSVFIVEFNATDGVDVQRGDFNMGAAALTDTDDITAVTQANSIVHNPSFAGMGKSGGSGSDDVPASFVEYNFTDSDTVDGERGSHGGSVVQHNWEVIDFTYGAPPPTAYSGWGINRGINRGIL